MIFIVDSDGKEIYNRSGAPRGDGLKTLLVRGIEQTGGIKDVGSGASSGRDKQLAIDLRKAKMMLGKNSTAAALKVLEKYVKDSTGLEGSSQGLAPNSGTFTAKNKDAENKDAPKSRAEKAMDELLAKISQDGNAELKRAVGFASDGKALIGAVALARVDRIYGDWKPLRGQIAQAKQTLGTAGTQGKLLAQAELIDEARALEEKNLNRLAKTAYEKVVATFPDTDAAVLSKTRILQLTPARTWTDKTGKHKVQAVLVAVDEAQVKLRKKDGKVVTLEREALSEVDQKYLQSTQ